MKVFGNDDFSIGAEVTDREGDWVFGHFCFLVAGQRIGDLNDATDMKGCLHWLKELDASASYRWEPSLADLDAETVFSIAFDELMAPRGTKNPKLPDAVQRFHIGHVGMSSFDRFDVMLLGVADGRNRLLWRQADGPAQDALLPTSLVASAIAECVDYLGLVTLYET